MAKYRVRWLYDNWGEFIVEAPSENVALQAAADRIENGYYAFSNGMTTYECSDPIDDEEDDPYIDHITAANPDQTL